MSRVLCALLCVLLPVVAAPARGGDAFERVSPAEAGYSAERLEALRNLLARSGSESLLLLHDGKVFYEWGDVRRKRLVHSIRKPLLHALIGRELGRGCLQMDRTLQDYGVDEDPPGLTAQERSATLRQLLQSRSGVYHPAAAETEGMQAQRPARGSHAPGTYYYYNNWDFNVAGALYEQCAGRMIHAAFLEDIARPLGMLDYAGRVEAWPQDGDPIPTDADGFRKREPERSRFGAYHFRLSAHDLALFGQLYLDHGQWRGEQLVPADWIDESTQPASILDERYGLAYGQLWDVLVPEDGDARPSFYHTGLGVHMLGVYPKHGLVLVHRVDTERDGVTFDEGNLYRIIRAVHAARMP
ncbi:MAG: beta-lactamase family protein [Proteobacteria bacterium]|nr:beta-lactamase family protein [Pseudomonadota bacterium]